MSKRQITDMAADAVALSKEHADRAEAAEQALRRIRLLHTPAGPDQWNPEYCTADKELWPCRTIQALSDDDALHEHVYVWNDLGKLGHVYACQDCGRLGLP